MKDKLFTGNNHFRFNRAKVVFVLLKNLMVATFLRNALVFGENDDSQYKSSY